MPTDPRHQRSLPSGLHLARVLGRFFVRQKGEALARLRRGDLRPPDLLAWLPTMVEVAAPLVEGYYRGGVRDAAARLGLAVRVSRGLVASGRASGLRPDTALFGPVDTPGQPAGSQRGVGVRPLHRSAGRLFARLLRKDVGRAALAIDFAYLNPRILEAARQLTFAFCQATLDTLTGDMGRELARLRAALAGGLEAGESLHGLTARVLAVFDDRARALRIAQTESSRAVHAGQLLAAKESGVVRGKKWLASSDACLRCRALDGRTVGLDEPFAVVGTGPYSVVMHAPLHPACQCTWTEVIG